MGGGSTDRGRGVAGHQVSEIIEGDSRHILATIAESSIDSVVTDPPYALVSITKRFGSEDAAPAKGDVYARAAAGFMGKKWDTGETAFDPLFWREVLRVLKPGGHLLAFGGTRSYHRLACAVEDAGFEIRDQIGWLYGSGFPKSHNQGNGWGTALKPAWEPIVMARKPLIGTVAANVLEHGTGAINIDGCRVGDERGRWPANVTHDGSEEVLAAFPEAPGQLADASSSSEGRKNQNVYGEMRRGRGDEPSANSENEGSVGFKMKPGQRRLDSGSAARFFYCAKASKSDREDGNTHPTVKPTALMRYLCRLVTPPGGTVLDPFVGSGSTGKAASLEGFNFVGIEREAEYAAIARARLGLDPFA
jgi:site-specific DNA-methyltransferase (adenine-specific)